MIVLKETVEIDKLRVNKFIEGEEYLLLDRYAIGVYLGKSSAQHIFMITHKSKVTSNHNTNLFRESWGSTQVDGIWMQSWFIPVYNKYKTKISNFSNLHFIQIYANRRLCKEETFIHISDSPLSKTELDYPLIPEKYKTILKTIKKKFNRKTYDYQIANHLLSKLPKEFCQIVDTGVIIPAANEKSAVVFILNKDRVIKALNKVNKQTGYLELEQFKTVLVNNLEQTKIGRIVKKFSGNLFPDDKIDSFANTFNSMIMDLSTYKLEVVKGKDIEHWYNGANYTTDTNGTLQGSCMRYANCTNQWKFYGFLPNCEMVVLTIADKLHARALIWTTTTGKKYMDRIYYTSEIEKKMLVKWGLDNKMDDNYEDWHERGVISDTLFVDCDVQKLFAGKEEICFPYFDSFRMLTCDLKTLCLSSDRIKNLSKADIEFCKKQAFGMNRNSILNQVERWKNPPKTDMGIKYLKEGQMNVFIIDSNTAICKWEVMPEGSGELKPSEERFEITTNSEKNLKEIEKEFEKLINA